MSIGKFWSNCVHSERNYILIKRGGLYLSLYRTPSMYTLWLQLDVWSKITLTVHMRPIPTWCDSSTKPRRMVISSRSLLLLHRRIMHCWACSLITENSRIRLGLSEPVLGPLFKSAEFKLQGTAQKCSHSLQHRGKYSFFYGYFREIWQISACQNAAILIKAWCMYTHMIGLYDSLSV